MKHFGLIFCILLYINNISAQLLSSEALNNEPVYTSLETAMAQPLHVYRLKLKIRQDSIPAQVFEMKNLQELTLSKCRLAVVDERIGELTHLQKLNLGSNRLVRLPESLGKLSELQELIICRNMIEALPESIGKLTQLTYIDAWENPLYVFPESIRALQKTLRTIDLRQVALKNSELDKMELLLPYTDIKITSTCECNDGRED